MKRAVLIVVVLWFILTVAYGYATVAGKLALPPSPERYTNTAGFQVASFLVAKVPPLLVLLLAILGMQLLFMRAQSPPSVSTSGRRLMRRTAVLGVAVIFVMLVRFMLVSDLPYNPWFQYDEQLILHFLWTRLPAYAGILATILLGELTWYRSRAS